MILKWRRRKSALRAVGPVVHRLGDIGHPFNDEPAGDRVGRGQNADACRLVVKLTSNSAGKISS